MPFAPERAGTGTRDYVWNGSLLLKKSATSSERALLNPNGCLAIAAAVVDLLCVKIACPTAANCGVEAR